MWGGNIDGLPNVHDNEDKRRMTSVIELFHLPTGRWEQRPTYGKPPLGVWSYASTVIGNKIYYFGGHCNHDECRHNSLNSLSTELLRWYKMSSPNSHQGPMMKSSSEMIHVQIKKADYLLIVGGFGLAPISLQPGAQYNNFSTNEHHYYELATGKKFNINILYP